VPGFQVLGFQVPDSLFFSASIRTESICTACVGHNSGWAIKAKLDKGLRL